MSRALLDVNVLIALLDADHVDHGTARAWIVSEIRHGWASCALTENGFVRVVSQPRYPSPVPPAAALARLARATATEHHAFWPCDLSLLDRRRIDPTRVHGSRQVADVYLLALATAHGGRFVTFDRSVPLSAVPGARARDLVVLERPPGKRLAGSSRRVARLPGGHRGRPRAARVRPCEREPPRPGRGRRRTR